MLPIGGAACAGGTWLCNVLTFISEEGGGLAAASAISYSVCPKMVCARYAGVHRAGTGGGDRNAVPIWRRPQCCYGALVSLSVRFLHVCLGLRDAACLCRGVLAALLPAKLPKAEEGHVGYGVSAHLSLWRVCLHACIGELGVPACALADHQCYSVYLAGPNCTPQPYGPSPMTSFLQKAGSCSRGNFQPAPAA